MQALEGKRFSGSMLGATRLGAGRVRRASAPASAAVGFGAPPPPSLAAEQIPLPVLQSSDLLHGSGEGGSATGAQWQPSQVTPPPRACAASLQPPPAPQAPTPPALHRVASDLPAPSPAPSETVTHAPHVHPRARAASEAAAPVHEDGYLHGAHVHGPRAGPRRDTIHRADKRLNKGRNN